MNFEVLQRYYNAGDRLAREIFDECCDYWSNCLTTLLYAYDPEVVVLSGGVLHWGEELTGRLFRNVSEHAWTPWGKPDFRLAKNPEHSVLLGLHYMNQKKMESGNL